MHEFDHTVLHIMRLYIFLGTRVLFHFRFERDLRTIWLFESITKFVTVCLQLTRDAWYTVPNYQLGNYVSSSMTIFSFFFFLMDVRCRCPFFSRLIHFLPACKQPYASPGENCKAWRIDNGFTTTPKNWFSPGSSERDPSTFDSGNQETLCQLSRDEFASLKRSRRRSVTAAAAAFFFLLVHCKHVRDVAFTMSANRSTRTTIYENISNCLGMCVCVCH